MFISCVLVSIVSAGFVVGIGESTILVVLGYLIAVGIMVVTVVA